MSDFPEPAFMADEEIRMFADSVGKFLDRNAPPERVAKWREAGMVEREFWREAGAGGAARGQRARGLWRAGRRFPP